MARSTKHTGRRKAVSRPAFLLQGPIMLGIMLLGIVVYIGVMTTFTGVIQANIVETLTDVPTMYAHHPDTGARMTAVPEDVLLANSADLNRRAELLQMIKELTAPDAGGEESPGGTVAQVVTSAALGQGGELLRGGVNYVQLQAYNAELHDINERLIAAGWFDENATIIKHYRYFAIPSTVLLVMMMVFSAAGHFMERGFGLWRQGTAADMFRGAIIGLIIIWLIPEVWDIFALGMEDLSLDMMSLGGDHPQRIINDLWCKMGASAECMFDFSTILDPLRWSTALTSPADFGTSLMFEVLLPFFKIVPALTVTLTMYIMGEVRVLFISIVLITLPLWLVLRHLPIIKDHAKSLVYSMVGASIAPFFSALTLYVGWEYVMNTPLDTLEEWISALGIVTLAGSWPLLLAPFLGKISKEVSGYVQTAVMSTTMMAAQMGTGMAAGGMKAAQQGHGLTGILQGMAMGGGASMITAMPQGMGKQMDQAGKSVGLETGPMFTPPKQSGFQDDGGESAGGFGVGGGTNGPATPSGGGGPGAGGIPGAGGAQGASEGGHGFDSGAASAGATPSGFDTGASQDAMGNLGAGGGGSSGGGGGGPTSGGG
ncbi:MAG: hypothetical protein OXK17_06505 [Thaumarchaeota archaeon]|nr:hypothetical protein [Nitrososphaerota archaeon]